MSETISSAAPAAAAQTDADAARARLLGVGLVVAVVLAYLPALFAGYVWDDAERLLDNEHLVGLDGLRRIWLEPGATYQYYPLVFTMWWIERALWDLWAPGFHAVNVALHAGSTIVLWRLLRDLRVPGALLAAALFALHPVHVESVAWVSERKNTLSGLFYLGAALALLPAFLEGDKRRLDGRFALGVFLFVCALLSKAVTASLPAALLLVAYWHRGRLCRRDFALAVPLLIVGAGLGLLSAKLEVTHVGSPDGGWVGGLPEQLQLAARVPWFYLSKLVLPVDLAFIYPRWSLDRGDLAAWAWAVPTVLALALAFFARRRVGRAPLVVLLFFGGTLLPVLGFFSVYPMRYSFVADHFQYLASIGPLALVAGGATLAARRWPMPVGARLSLVGACLAVLGALTFSRSLAFYDERTLYLDTLEKNPGCSLCLTNLALMAKREGENEEARALYERALKADPTNGEAHHTFALLLVPMGEPGPAERHFALATELLPHTSIPPTEHGVLLGGQGRFQEAEAILAEARRRNADNARAALFHGLALKELGRREEAIAALEEAARLAPGEARPRALLEELKAAPPAR